MSTTYGQQVVEQAAALIKQGRDANQIAKILFDRDDQGHNYGIGIILGGDGKPMPTSPTLLDHARRELERSGAGTYVNSNALLGKLKAAVLSWQRVPQEHWDRFHLALPSDAGTGAVQTAVEVALMLRSDREVLGVEELGWPAYRAIAKTAHLGFQAYPLEGVITGERVLPLYQAGPMNTTGRVRGAEIVQARARAAAGAGDLVVLDRAYSGFEFAHRLGEASYDDVMRASYELQIAPFIDAGVPFLLAVSPTKAFVTFSLRPAGLLLAYVPDAAQDDAVSGALNTVVRARGSSFEHPLTRAFARALTDDLARLEAEHEAAMQRVAESEARWSRLAAGTPIAYLFTDTYAGLFRNPEARPDAAAHIYGEHLYPVFSDGRCRLNVTGIPNDDELARRHVEVFASQCL